MKQPDNHPTSTTDTTTTLTAEQLRQLIEGYFDCRLTEAQEALLRQQLATTPHRDDVIDEARAVMGYYSVAQSAAHRQQQPTSVRSSRRLWIAAAAAIAVLVAVAVSVLHRGSLDQLTPDNGCIALVNGQTITDDQAVIELLNRDLDAIGDAHQGIEQGVIDQLHSLGEAMDGQ